MGRIRRLVLDTLKPHDPSIIDMADQLSDLDGISAVNISIYEMDRKVENAKITIEGDSIRKWGAPFTPWMKSRQAGTSSTMLRRY